MGEGDAPDLDQLLVVALHEAGHLVVARAVGVPAGQARVWHDEEGWHGEVRYAGVGGELALLTAAAAGAVAVAEYFSEPVDERPDAVELGHLPPAQLAAFRSRARVILRVRWDEVLEEASSLVRRAA